MNSVKALKADAEKRKKHGEQQVDFETAAQLMDLSSLMEECGVDETTFKQEGAKIWNRLNQLQSRDPTEYQAFIEKQVQQYAGQDGEELQSSMSNPEAFLSKMKRTKAMEEKRGEKIKVCTGEEKGDDLGVNHEAEVLIGQELKKTAGISGHIPKVVEMTVSSELSNPEQKTGKDSSFSAKRSRTRVKQGMRKGFLASDSKHKPIYETGSREGQPSSLLQKCKLVDLSGGNSEDVEAKTRQHY